MTDFAAAKRRSVIDDVAILNEKIGSSRRLTLQFKRSRCRARSLALVEKNSSGLSHFLRPLHEKLVARTGYAVVLRILEGSLHSFGSEGVFAIGLSTKQKGSSRILG